MAKGSPDGTNLKLGSSVTLTPAATGISTNPVSVIIVCGEELIELNQANSWTDTSVLADKVTDEGCVQIDVYVYYNGSNADVYSNNAAHLGGVTIAFNLVVE